MIWTFALFVPSYAAAVNVTIIVDYMPPPDFNGGPNEYRAGSTVTLTCLRLVEEGGGTETEYNWTSTCSSCFVTNQTAQTISRAALRSIDSGSHTCNATNPFTGESGNATIEINVVGEYSTVAS